MCERVNVMYAGRIVETGSVDDIFENPRMPYTWGLLDSLPRLDEQKGARLRTIEGLPPDLINPGRRAASRRAADTRVTSAASRSPSSSRARKRATCARCHGTEPGGWIQ